jgi:hypothetical protein
MNLSLSIYASIISELPVLGVFDCLVSLSHIHTLDRFQLLGNVGSSRVLLVFHGVPFAFSTQHLDLVLHGLPCT